MGKAGKCIAMLQILNTGKVYKVSELAELLETNPRNIIEYKKELEEFGYYIENIPGRYGGYRLENTVLLPALKFTDEEKKILLEGNNYLTNRYEFPYKKEFDLCVAKIISTIAHEGLSNDILVINKYPYQMSDTDIRIRYDQIKNSIKKREIINIKYQFNDDLKEINFHPYEIFMYDNFWYVIGWNEQINDIDYLKINRMNLITGLKKKYTKWKSYNSSDYLEPTGFKKEQWYHLELKVDKSFIGQIKERVYGKNQEITFEKNKYILKVDIQNKEEIITLVLSFGNNVEVLEPTWLKDELLNTAKLYLKIYK